MDKKHSIPPKLAQRFLLWFLSEELAEEVIGDLEEKYNNTLKSNTTTRAKLNYWYQVINYLRPFALKNYRSNSNNYAMFRNYFKIGFRNLIKYKSFSAINILGLSLGFLCSLLIYLWIQDEVEMDAFHANLDRIYTVTSREYRGSELSYTGYDTPGRLGKELEQVFPEVQFGCNISWKEYHTFSTDKDKRVKLGGYYAEEGFFQIFSYPLLSGRRDTALKSPNSIAISRKMAELLFGNAESALDQGIKFENDQEFKITAVFEDLGTNVSDKFDYIINWNFFAKRNKWIENWHNSGPNTYIMLVEGASANGLKPKIRGFIKSYDAKYTEVNRMELDLQPYEDKYLYSKFENGQVAGGRIESVRLFGWVAVFILLIASINFMNLSTARSLRRAKEIGVRKVNGAKRISLIYQFLFEALIISTIAILLSILVTTLVLPVFNSLTDKLLSVPFSNWNFWMALFGLNLITALLSGSYPAFLLSSYKPVRILKQGLKNEAYSTILRKGLVVFQFALATIFIVGMLTVSEQMKFIQNKNLGYQKDHLLYVPLVGNVAKNFETFKNKARQMTGIQSVSQMSNRFVKLENTTSGVDWIGKDPDAKAVFTTNAVGYDFTKTMKVNMIRGRDFSRNHADSSNYIINESAMKLIGYDDPIGKPITFNGSDGTIIGVIKDFHFNSLHIPIEPIILRFKKWNGGGMAVVRIDPDHTTSAIDHLERLHKELNPEFIFSYQFVEDEIGALYSSERVVKKLAGYFAFLAIFISCLGLLGLVMFTVEQRTKEVGIRKVLGAGVVQIATLLTKDFVKLVLISIIISIPFAHVAMESWLTGFEYRIDIKWWVFALAGIGSLIIALATVVVQSIKASFINPVDSIRNE